MNDVENQIKITEKEKGIRIDKYLSTYFNELSRSMIQTLIDQDDILVNQASVKTSYKLKDGDVIDIIDLTIDSKEIIPVDLPIDIVYEDDDVLVVNKPSGMVVHPAPGHYQDTLVNALMYHIDSLSDGSSSARPGIVHRIDKDTSGLLMVAKNNYAHDVLAKELQKKKTKRSYVALVKGVIKNKSGRIQAPIKRDPNNRIKMAVMAGGKEAITHFEVLEQFEDATLIECRLETGRTHQIRVHMDYIGYPVINDPIYGESTDDFGQYLHAKTLGFTHPKTKAWMEFDSELPNEFNEYIKKIRH
jgi:23S rRNA pseudouridine1911/1915/1917 synthase